MYKTKEKVLHDQRLILIRDRALSWKKKKLLIVADPHFVKAQIFRDTGIPVPGRTTADDLKRIVPDGSVSPWQAFFSRRFNPWPN